METEKKFVITMSQLKEMRSSKDEERKVDIYAEVLSQPYREKSSGEIVSGGIVKGAGALGRGIVKGAGDLSGVLYDALEKATEPPKKGGKKS